MKILIAAAAAIGSWSDIPGGSWHPGEVAIAEIRSGVRQFVQESAKKRGKNLQEWSLYSFQYQAREKAGQRFVFINAFCIAPPDYAQKRFVLVTDGGPCFFNLKYDPQRRVFFDLEFNGEG